MSHSKTLQQTPSMQVGKTNHADVTIDPILTALQSFGQALVDCKILDGIDLDNQQADCPVLLFLIAPPDFGIAIYRDSGIAKGEGSEIIVERTHLEAMGEYPLIQMSQFSEDLPAICRFLFEEIEAIKAIIKAEET